MKVELTEPEVEMILEDIFSTHEYLDQSLRTGVWTQSPPAGTEREEAIGRVRIAESIIKKLGGEL